MGEVDKDKLQAVLQRVCFPVDQAAMEAREPQPMNDLSDVIPLPVHLRTWVAQRIEWATSSESITQDIRGHEGDDGDAAVAHARDTRELKEAAKQDRMEDALPQTPQRSGGAGNTKGGTWTPTQARVVALCERVREFVQANGEAVRRRNRSYRRQGRWMLYPARPYSLTHTFAIYLDLSGSMYQHWEVLAGVARWARGEGAKVFTFDTAVVAWEDGKPFQAGGGTLWQPILESAKKEGLGALVVVTDGDFFDRLEDPGLPVLWILTQEKRMPFGQTLDITKAAVIG
jgi:hypothetical protein